MNLLQDQHILILGLGDSGLSMLRWCLLQGARVTVVDSREQPPGLPSLKEEKSGVEFVHSPFTAALLEANDIRAVFKSPGLTPTEVAAVWQAAQAKGLWCGTELSLFAHALEHLKNSEQAYQPKVLAITGTNGKTTVTRLTGLLMQRAGKTVAVAGNIGPALLDTLTQHLQALPEVWVLELSSFQLDGVDNFEPTAACVLNLTQDHLDWHGDMLAYGKAKANIFGQHAVGVLPRNDAAVMAMWPADRGRKKEVPRARIHFGADMPQHPGDWGLSTENGMTWLVRAMPSEDTGGKRGRAVDEELQIQRLMPADALRIRGQHNALNALAALALASTCSTHLAQMLHGLREYSGEPHRLTSVAVIQDIEYFDDSKGTNVGATVAAINSLGAERKLVVILGGDGKGQDFSPLGDPLKRHARAVVLIGRDAPLLQEALKAYGVDCLHAKDMAQAVEIAAQHAQTGDAVLLSPACASLDMYLNYVARAEAFVLAVQDIAMLEGQP
ncbi:MAG: UDP-N-acetylmuramoyl-L-alanine--D-glutamate ligase [Betaproteobacteria bacterium]|nr:UDP-N-acetylmuramoyl-L-alanine--D-glutamate ligase [Betaproteobacteria bacterium]